MRRHVRSRATYRVIEARKRAREARRNLSRLGWFRRCCVRVIPKIGKFASEVSVEMFVVITVWLYGRIS